jgi:hypothetical protein
MLEKHRIQEILEEEKEKERQEENLLQKIKEEEKEALEKIRILQIQEEEKEKETAERKAKEEQGKKNQTEKNILSKKERFLEKLKPKVTEEEEEEEEIDETNKAELRKKIDPVFRCFENRDNFKEKSTLRNINRNQKKFMEKVGPGDLDSLCRDLIDRSDVPEKNQVGRQNYVWNIGNRSQHGDV